MSSLKSSSELKAISREQLTGNYKTTVLSFLLFYVFTILASDIISIASDMQSAFGVLLYIILFLIGSSFLCVFAIGFAQMFLKLSCKKDIQVGDIFYGFKNNLNHYITISAVFISGTFLPVFISMWIVGIAQASSEAIVCFLYYALAAAFLIFAMIILLKYSLVFFITLDFPQYDVKKVFKMSAYLMKGNQCRLLYIFVSFLPIYLLSFLTLPVGTIATLGSFWIAPYICATHANFYLNLIRSKSN